MTSACIRCAADLATVPGQPRRGMCNRCYDVTLRAGELDTSLAPRPGFTEIDVSWHEDALCAETDPEAWFPEKGGSTREAKAICRDCLVRAECLEYALETGQRFGIWGGVSERERRRLLGLPDDDEEASAA